MTVGGTVGVVVTVEVLVGVLVGGQLTTQGVAVGVAVSVGVAVTDGGTVDVGVPVAGGVGRSFLQSWTTPTGAQRAASLELGCRGERYSPASVAASDRRIAARSTKQIRRLVMILQYSDRSCSRSYACSEGMSIAVY